MTQEEIEKIFNYDATHKFIINHLDENSLKLVKSLLFTLKSEDFKELNQEGQFDFTDLPIPQDSLSKCGNNESLTFSQEIEGILQNLLKKINIEGSNLEYPYLFAGFTGDKERYCALKDFPVGNGQNCSYDWGFIEDFIKNNDEMSLAIFHTHPKPFGEGHQTLYNKHTEELSKQGVKAEGLNISLADIYAQMYLENLVKKYNKNIDTQSIILMHDGHLLSFSAQKGIQIDSKKDLLSHIENDDEFERF